jgi:hypothetical protein
MHTSTRPARSSMVSGSASSPISGLRVKHMFVMGSDRACHITTETTDKHTIKHMNLHTKRKRNIEVCALYLRHD